MDRKEIMNALERIRKACTGRCEECKFGTIEEMCKLKETNPDEWTPEAMGFRCRDCEYKASECCERCGVLARPDVIMGVRYRAIDGIPSQEPYEVVVRLTNGNTVMYRRVN
jgi:hypothetical protein